MLLVCLYQTCSSAVKEIPQITRPAKFITPHCSPAGLSPHGSPNYDGNIVEAAHGRPSLAWIFRTIIPVRLSDSAE
jgi:hypothetical protein